MSEDANSVGNGTANGNSNGSSVNPLPPHPDQPKVNITHPPPPVAPGGYPPMYMNYNDFPPPPMYPPKYYDYSRAPYPDPYEGYYNPMDSRAYDYRRQDTVVMPSGELPVDDDVDTRSVYVGNLDYGATSTELQYHFSRCGNITRVTIINDKFTRQPKGYAYVEFADEESANNGLAMNDSIFLGRPIKVSRKRNNHMMLVSQNRARYRAPFPPMAAGRRPAAAYPPRRPVNPNFYHPYY